MTESTRQRLPAHLTRYVIKQDYARYTSEDQAVWRYIMRQLKSFLSKHAHSAYLEGLQKSGLSVERIPEIEFMDQSLERFGWGAVPVSGFIPPAAFMEFQALGILPIASDMRTLEHLLYTPAPDIVHEAAGHAPILVNPDYGAYLRLYGEVARHSIIGKQDMAQYEAIRILSDLKEDPGSHPETIRQAEQTLAEITAAITSVSEAALLSRMNWWTAEYGLVGSLQNPKLFGAGLLSSVGESRSCLSAKVKKIPLSVDCVNYSYDITEPQPHLFVAQDFAHLGHVLQELAERLAYRRGGLYGLERAVESSTVNTVQLNSGIQITGVLKTFKLNANSPSYLTFSGPCQLAWDNRELPGQGTAQHAQGFSTPVGTVQGRCLSTFTEGDLNRLGLRQGQKVALVFDSGCEVQGQVENFIFQHGKVVVISWIACRVSMGQELLFDPAWGTFDMAVGSQVTSVFAGPADRERFGETEDFVAKQIPARRFSEDLLRRHDLFRRVRALRENRVQWLSPSSSQEVENLTRAVSAAPETDWLAGIELIELCSRMKLPAQAQALRNHLQPENFTSPSTRFCVQDGLELAETDL